MSPIKPNPKDAVNVSSRLLLVFVVVCSFLKVSHAIAKEIVIRNFGATLERESSSKHVYLFNIDGSEPLSPIGKIFLLKKTGSPIAAMRVLKVYENKRELAAKRIKSYPALSLLTTHGSYDAVEKTGDLNESAPPPNTPEDQKDLQELENPSPQVSPEDEIPTEAGDLGEILDYDPELDSGSSPPPQDDEVSEFPGEKTLIAEEFNLLDPELYWVSVNIGMLRNYSLSFDTDGNPQRGSALYSTGLGLRYGKTVAMLPYIKKNQIQDSFTLEGGVYYYTISNYSQNSGDNYSIMPLILTGRYNVVFGETYGVFAYAGVMKNFVLSSENAATGASDVLGGFDPALGIGLLFRVGPNWVVRTDIGYDIISAGLVLRF